MTTLSHLWLELRRSFWERVLTVVVDYLPWYPPTHDLGPVDHTLLEAISKWSMLSAASIASKNYRRQRPWTDAGVLDLMSKKVFHESYRWLWGGGSSKGGRP